MSAFLLLPLWAVGSCFFLAVCLFCWLAAKLGTWLFCWAFDKGFSNEHRELVSFLVRHAREDAKWAREYDRMGRACYCGGEPERARAMWERRDALRTMVYSRLHLARDVKGGRK